MSDVKTRLSVRISGDIKDAILSISYKEKISESEIIRSAFEKFIHGYESGDGSIDVIKDRLRVKKLERRLKDLHKISSFNQRMLRKICYMILYNDGLDKLRWVLIQQSREDLIFDSDKACINQLLSFINSGDPEGLFHFLKKNVELYRLKYKLMDVQEDLIDTFHLKIRKLFINQNA